MSFVFLFKQKTAYEMRISDWSSDVCSSDLGGEGGRGDQPGDRGQPRIPALVGRTEPVGKPAAREDARGAADEEQRSHELAGGNEIEAETAHQHCRGP